MPSQVTVLSRAGEESVPPTLAARIREDAELRFARRDGAPDVDEAAALLDGATVLASTNVTLPTLDDDLLRRCPSLRHVVLYATGHEHVDLAALERRGITLSTLPTYATTAVAEAALGMLLTLATRSHLANDRARGLVPADVSLRGVELCGRTLGVVGVGRIGTRLATLARGIGMRVLGTDIDPAARAAATAAGIPVTDPGDLLHRADAVAVCASTEPAATAILDAAAIARLRHGALVVNVGRPVLVDNGAMVAAIRSGAVRGFAVDEVVLDPAEHADLLSEGRVVQTAHSAWWRDEVLERGAVLFGEAILAAVHGAPVDVATADRRESVA